MIHPFAFAFACTFAFAIASIEGIDGIQHVYYYNRVTRESRWCVTARSRRATVAQRIGGESAENPDAPRDRSIDAFHSSFARVRENERLTTSIRRAC